MEKRPSTLSGMGFHGKWGWSIDMRRQVHKLFYDSLVDSIQNIVEAEGFKEMQEVDWGRIKICFVVLHSLVSFKDLSHK